MRPLECDALKSLFDEFGTNCTVSGLLVIRCACQHFHKVSEFYSRSLIYFDSILFESIFGRLYHRVWAQLELFCFLTLLRSGYMEDCYIKPLYILHCLCQQCDIIMDGSRTARAHMYSGKAECPHGLVQPHSPCSLTKPSVFSLGKLLFCQSQYYSTSLAQVANVVGEIRDKQSPTGPSSAVCMRVHTLDPWSWDLRIVASMRGC